jgi:hypothetical protein
MGGNSILALAAEVKEWRIASGVAPEVRVESEAGTA